MPGSSILPRCALVIALFSLTVTGMPFLSQRPKVPSKFERTKGPCGPGEYFTDMPEVRCLPCPSNQFQNESEHNYRQCKPCRPGAPSSRQVLISKCASTHDTIFLCRSGFFRKFDTVVGDSCVACSECGVSEPSAPVMAAPCGIHSDTLCCRTGLKHYANGTWICGGQRGEKQMAEDHGNERSENTKDDVLAISEDFRNDSFIKNNSIARGNDSMAEDRASERSEHTKENVLAISENFRNNKNNSIARGNDSMAEDRGNEKGEHTQKDALAVSEDFRNDSFIRNDSIIHADDSEISHSHPGSNWRLGETQMSEEERTLRATGVFIALGSLGMLGCAVFIKAFLENRQSLKIVFRCARQGMERTRPGNDNAYGTFSP